MMTMMLVVFVMVLGIAMPAIIMVMLPGVNDYTWLRCRNCNTGCGADSAADNGTVASTDGGADRCAGPAADGPAKYGAAVHLMEPVRACRSCEGQEHAQSQCG